MTNNTGRRALLLLCALSAPAAGADPAADLARAVEEAARQVLEQQVDRMGLVAPSITASMQPLLRPPPACKSRLSVETVDVRNAQRMRFTVRCPGDDWSQKVTVRGRIAADVVVASSDIQAGRPIQEGDVSLDQRDVTQVPDAFGDTAEVLGMTGRRALHPGDILRKKLLSAAIAVKRGDEVLIVARNGGIEVQMTGEALDTGATGDTVRVRNLSSGVVVRARVTGPGEVEPVSRARD
ncbi:flagellar basal body P-ring formation chaperone FlgA [Methyloversatilis thermotolerans]|uniref:flagellar basal body P-ring formation chaperone FlgA n=1 Tax=Methyloversatilis thermotolerans TaxID=1346290 RepID=UPI000373C253|nr:flagellar basal body P-ring formation chaperone FlgA [Methyloversatilis thermotolerans]